MQAAKATVTQDIQTALLSQRDFISAQIALILEKLNTRDTQLQNLKEQTDRQGAELRRLSHDIYRLHKDDGDEVD